MKKIFLAFIAAITLFTACEDKYNDQFEGMEDKVWKAYTPTLEYTLTATDYTTISTAITNNANATAEEKALAATVKSKQAIPDLIKLSDYAPAILAKLYKTFDFGGACVVKYNRYFGDDYVANLTAKYSYTLVAPTDYDAMGTASGTPGKYDNFSSSILPDNYLPTFLRTKYPYALKGEIAAVTYQYYISSSLTETRTTKYKYDGTVWSSTFVLTEAKSEQYLFSGTFWFFDPAVKFTASKTDLALIVDWVKTNKGTNFLDSYGTAEFYSGASAYRGNVDYTLPSRKSYDSENFPDYITAEAAKVIMDARIKETMPEMLKVKYPNSVAQVNGVDVFYTIIYEVWDNPNRGNYQLVYKCTGPGTFTYVSGPTKL